MVQKLQEADSRKEEPKHLERILLFPKLLGPATTSTVALKMGGRALEKICRGFGSRNGETPQSYLLRGRQEGMRLGLLSIGGEPRRGAQSRVLLRRAFRILRSARGERRVGSHQEPPRAETTQGQKVCRIYKPAGKCTQN